MKNFLLALSNWAAHVAGLYGYYHSFFERITSKGSKKSPPWANRYWVKQPHTRKRDPKTNRPVELDPFDDIPF